MEHVKETIHDATKSYTRANRSVPMIYVKVKAILKIFREGVKKIFNYYIFLVIYLSIGESTWLYSCQRNLSSRYKTTKFTC